MHQDQRIGLALGILLVGACAAFFFRNETRSNTPRLQHAQELDDRIAEKSTRPYLKGIEAVEASDQKQVDVITVQRSKSTQQDGGFFSAVDPFSTNKSTDKSFGDRKTAPKPATADSDVEELAPIAIPTDDYVVQQAPAHLNPPLASDSTGRPSTSKSAAGSIEGRTHVVQKGDTLSSIAARTLGSPNRFHDIFEANRDQLNDANDLKLGMTLRIPTKTDAATKPVPTKVRLSVEPESPAIDHAPLFDDSLNRSEPPVFESRTVPPIQEPSAPTKILLPPEISAEPRIESPVDQPASEETGPNRKFVPARRIPGRPIGPQAKATTPPEKSGRRLSQVSLESTAGKVAR